MQESIVEREDQLNKRLQQQQKENNQLQQRLVELESRVTDCQRKEAAAMQREEKARGLWVILIDLSVVRLTVKLLYFAQGEHTEYFAVTLNSSGPGFTNVLREILPYDEIGTHRFDLILNSLEWVCHVLYLVYTLWCYWKNLLIQNFLEILENLWVIICGPRKTFLNSGPGSYRICVP